MTTRRKVGLLLTGFLAMSGLSLADQRGRKFENIPDMLLASLANAGVEIETKALIHALATHTDSQIRAEAADVLGLLKESSARPALLRSLEKDTDPTVRQSAALALARLGDEAGRLALKRDFADATEQFWKLYLAARLAEIGAADGYSYVAEAAASSIASTRVMAVQSLLWFVPLTGVTDGLGRSPSQLLLDLAGDENVEVRLEVVTYLGAAVLKGMSKELALSTTRRLAEQDRDPRVRDAAKALLESWNCDEELREPAGFSSRPQPRDKLRRPG